MAVEILVMVATERNGELVTDLASQSFGLSELDVMRIGRCALANDARLRSNKHKMLLAALSHLLFKRCCGWANGESLRRLGNPARGLPIVID